MSPAEENKRSIGTQGEEAALAAYTGLGYSEVVRNWHFHRMGEIDLVLENRQSELLVICEVKLRKDASFSAPSCAVNSSKQKRIRKLAACFMMEHPSYRDYYVRFDVCEVIPDKDGGFCTNIIENAF